MSYSIGGVIGGIVILYLMTRLILLAFRDNKHKTSAVVISACIALAIATLLAGYGMADGNSPDFLNSFTTYLIPTPIVIAMEVIRLRRAKAKSASSEQPSHASDTESDNSSLE